MYRSLINHSCIYRSLLSPVYNRVDLGKREANIRIGGLACMTPPDTATSLLCQLAHRCMVAQNSRG